MDHHGPRTPAVIASVRCADTATRLRPGSRTSALRHAARPCERLCYATGVVLTLSGLAHLVVFAVQRRGVVDNFVGLAPWSLYGGYDMDQLCDAVVISEQHRMRKPEPAIFQLMLDMLGKPAEACVFVDDTEQYFAPAAELGDGGRPGEGPGGDDRTAGGPARSPLDLRPDLPCARVARSAQDVGHAMQVRAGRRPLQDSRGGLGGGTAVPRAGPQVDPLGVVRRSGGLAHRAGQVVQCGIAGRGEAGRRRTSRCHTPVRRS